MERARCLLDNHRQSRDIFHFSTVSSELLKASTEKVFISVSQKRKRRHKELKGLLKVTRPSRWGMGLERPTRARCPTPTKSSALPSHHTW